MSEPLHLFEGFGVEIEWMIVDVATASPRPIADVLLTTPEGEVVLERERGAARWSNELARHVIEVKTNGPAPSLAGLAGLFTEEARAMNAALAPHGARVLGGGMHPFFAPADAELWPHEQNDIYRAYDRVFGSKGHGWVNLQSVHLNLPFASDDELARLHDAIRLVLPLLPALAAASPFCGGRASGLLDTRLEVYRHNQAKVPEVAGGVVPERVRGRADYEERILAPMYVAIAPHDPEGILQEEWLNSRGAIARFDRMAVEIRVIDAQETPYADVAIVAAASALVRGLVEADRDLDAPTEPLRALFVRALRDAEATSLDDADHRALAGLGHRAPTLGALWRELLAAYPPDDEHAAALGVMLDQGPLARRMLRRAPTPDATSLRALCDELAGCLARGELFVP